MNWIIFGMGLTLGAILALALVLFQLQADYEDEHQ